MLYRTEPQKTLGSQLEVIKLGSCDKHPKCCCDWNVVRFITLIKFFSRPSPLSTKIKTCRLCWPGLGMSIVTLKGHRYSYLCEKLINIIYIFRGQSPADAEFNFLEVAKNLDLYGVDLHFAKVHKCIHFLSC